jgi:hypothetical protein
MGAIQSNFMTTLPTPKQATMLNDGGILVVLTKEDIFNLQEERAEYAQALFIHRGGSEPRQWRAMLETLNRILSQI